MDYDKLLKNYRKKPLVDPDTLKDRLLYGKKEIERIIPHRDPFLMIDTILSVNLDLGIIKGERFLSGEDSTFRGHFPGYPVYPGVLTVEMIGQLGLCLYYFLVNNTEKITAAARPANVRFTRIVGAYFIEPVLPESRITLVAKKLEQDSFFAKMIGQAIVGGRFACNTIVEVLIP